MPKKSPTFQSLETTLGYQFKNLELLKESLTHKSFANENAAANIRHNERLEFLGDAVLELIISDLLMTRFPTHAEGELSRLRAAIVNEAQLATLAGKLDLGSMVLLGKGEELTRGRKKNSILANTYEAILAAIYLDGGFTMAYEVVQEHFRKVIEAASHADFDKDYKTKLQEEAQKRFRKIPLYRIIEEIGPDHNKIFKVQVALNEDLATLGSGKSRKAAEQDAARLALQLLKEHDTF